MLMDNQLVFSNAQSLVTAASVASTVIDLTVQEDLGVGGGAATPKIFVQVGTAFVTANSATLNIQFQGSADGVTWTTYAESGALAASTLTAGQRVFGIDWPKRIASNTPLPRYVRLYYVLPASTAFTAGTLTAAVVLDRDDAPDTAGLYASNFVVA